MPSWTGVEAALAFTPTNGATSNIWAAETGTVDGTADSTVNGGIEGGAAAGSAGATGATGATKGPGGVAGRAAVPREATGHCIQLSAELNLMSSFVLCLMACIHTYYINPC